MPPSCFFKKNNILLLIVIGHWEKIGFAKRDPVPHVLEIGGATFVEKLFCKKCKALKDAHKEIDGMKRSMNRKLRAARRAGEEAKADELEASSRGFKQQVKNLKSEVNNLFDSNVQLHTHLNDANQQVEQLKVSSRQSITRGFLVMES